MTLEKMLELLVKNTRERAIKKSRVCTITYDDLVNLWDNQKGLCALTGYAMSYTIGDMRKVSIDRVDSSKGYTKDNIQLVCRLTNKAKSNMPNDEFIAMCQAVSHRIAAVQRLRAGLTPWLTPYRAIRSGRTR